MKNPLVILLVLSTLAAGQDNVQFVPSEVHVYPPATGTAEVWVSPTETASVGSVDLVIGSDTLEQISFAYAQSLLDAATFVDDPPGPHGLYPTDVRCGGFFSDPVAVPVLVGTVTIHGNGLAGGEYDLVVDSVRDMGFSSAGYSDGQGSHQEFLAGSALVVIHEELPCPDGVACEGATICDDGNPCTRDECVSGCCVNTPDVLGCDDGDFCNGAEACLDGSCVSSGNPCGGETPVCCESADLCAVECCSQDDCGVDQSCDAATGTCIELWELLVGSSLGGTAATSQYADGETATIEVPPFPVECSPFCIFVEWQGDVPASQRHDDPLQLEMDTDKDVTALFQAVGCIEDSHCSDDESCVDNECAPCVPVPTVCGSGAEGCMMIGLFGWVGLRNRSRRVRSSR